MEKVAQSSKSAVEEAFDEINDVLYSEAIVEKIPQREEEFVWEKQLKTWRKALDDRLWRQRSKRAKDENLALKQIQYAEKQNLVEKEQVIRLVS